MHRTATFAFTFGFLAACGAQKADVDAYEAATQEAYSAVQAHRDNSLAITTPEQCADEHQRYGADIRPKVQHMRSLADGMDGCMRNDGHMGRSGMQDISDAMMGELDHHDTAQCASSDQSQNRAEATRHCEAMEHYARQANEGANNAGTCGGAMMGGGGMM